LHARAQAHLLLSPSTIVIAGGAAKLVDHGVAALLSFAGAPPERAPAHCAPEQVDTALGIPSPFCDVFSLALLFMEVVLGASIFASIEPSQYYARLVDRAVRPSLREHGIGVAPAIERVLLRALAVDPRSRWPTAGLFWEALTDAVRIAPKTHALAARPSLSVASPKPVARVRAFTRGRESQVLAAAVALGITVFGLETFWRSRTRGRDAPVAASVVPSASTAVVASASVTSIANAPSIAPSASVERPPALEMLPVKVGSVHFLVDRTEVTVAAFRACIDAGKCSPTREHGYGWSEDDPLRKHFVCNLHVTGRERHPINCVTWNQATAYCAYAGKRLPREREWELAAHAGTKSRFPWGRDTPTCTRAVFARYGKEQWGCKDEPVGTAEVDAHPDTASPFGALDLAGNLWEWTADRDGSLAGLRGGGWDSSESNLTTTSRIDQAVFNGDVNVGFRCVKDD
jgi:formylglycine-generating enzyme required for sulfatase activity